MGTIQTILGDLYVDDQGNDHEPVALLWPSLFTDHSMWRYQITPLRAAGWRTLALDPPGHGRSKGLERDFTMDECAEAALQVLDALNVHTPVVVLGTSWGGMIAPRIALRAPDRVRGMVLFNTTAESATPFDRAKNTLLTWMLAIGALDKVVDRMNVSLIFSPETRRSKPELGAELSRNFRSWNRRGVINTVRAVLVDRDSTLDVLRNVKVPALVVSGKEDTILPLPHSRRIAEQLPKARHVEVPGAAHLVPLEAPDAGNSLISRLRSRFDSGSSWRIVIIRRHIETAGSAHRGCGKVWLSYNSPSYLAERHGLPAELVKNMAIVETLATQAAE